MGIHADSYSISNYHQIQEDRDEIIIIKTKTIMLLNELHGKRTLSETDFDKIRVLLDCAKNDPHIQFDKFLDILLNFFENPDKFGLYFPWKTSSIKFLDASYVYENKNLAHIKGLFRKYKPHEEKQSYEKSHFEMPSILTLIPALIKKTPYFLRFCIRSLPMILMTQINGADAKTQDSLEMIRSDTLLVSDVKPIGTLETLYSMFVQERVQVSQCNSVYDFYQDFPGNPGEFERIFILGAPQNDKILKAVECIQEFIKPKKTDLFLISHYSSMKPVKYKNPNLTCDQCIGWDDTEVLMKLFYQDMSVFSVNFFIDSWEILARGYTNYPNTNQHLGDAKYDKNIDIKYKKILAEIYKRCSSYRKAIEDLTESRYIHDPGYIHSKMIITPIIRSHLLDLLELIKKDMGIISNIISAIKIRPEGFNRGEDALLRTINLRSLILKNIENFHRKYSELNERMLSEVYNIVDDTEKEFFQKLLQPIFDQLNNLKEKLSTGYGYSMYQIIWEEMANSSQTYNQLIDKTINEDSIQPRNEKLKETLSKVEAESQGRVIVYAPRQQLISEAGFFNRHSKINTSNPQYKLRKSIQSDDKKDVILVMKPNL